MAKKKFYAVRNGAKVGIFNTWAECQEQVSGYSGAEFMAFGNLKQAQEYLGVTESSTNTNLDESCLTLEDKDQLEWLLNQILEEAWCGNVDTITKYTHNIADIFDIKLKQEEMA